MAFDAGDHASLTYLIQREKEAEERLEVLREEVLTWVKRGKLAVQADRPDLAREAKTRAIETKQQFDQAESELNSMRLQRESYKPTPAGPDVERTIQAEVLLEQFRMQGFSPEEQETRELTARIEAELALRAMKAPASTAPAGEAEPVTVETLEAATPENEPEVSHAVEDAAPEAELVAAETPEPAAPEAEAAVTPPEGEPPAPEPPPTEP